MLAQTATSSYELPPYIAFGKQNDRPTCYLIQAIVCDNTHICWDPQITLSRNQRDPERLPVYARVPDTVDLTELTTVAEIVSAQTPWKPFMVAPVEYARVVQDIVFSRVRPSTIGFVTHDCS